MEEKIFDPGLMVERGKREQRRMMVANGVLAGWGPKKITDHLWYNHRDLIPSESYDQAYNLICKDIERLFSDLDEPKKAKGYAAKIYEERQRKALEKAWHNATCELVDAVTLMHACGQTHAVASEVYRNAQMKLYVDIAKNIARVQGVDTERPTVVKHVEEWEVKVGEGGVARTQRKEEDEEAPN